MKQILQEIVEQFPNHYTRKVNGNKLLLNYVNSTRPSDLETLKEKIYIILNGEIEHVCKSCGNLTPFVSQEMGYREFCNSDCQQKFLIIDRERHAIEKLNSFGNLEYVSGYNGSHSMVVVKNKKCGCTFEAKYGNLFTNPNYCKFHGAQNRIEKLSERNKKGLTDLAKDKRKQTFLDKKLDKLEKIKLENEILENEILLGGRELISNFLSELVDQYRSSSEIILRRFSKIHRSIKKHYGERFGQKLFNFIHNIDSINDHPKCLECGKPVNYHPTSNRYSEFCSKKCKNKSKITIDRMYDTQLKKYGGWHFGTPESQAKSQATCIEKYGVPHGLQNKKILEKVWKSQFRLKPVTLPSGKIIKLMGYEPQVLNHLLTTEGFIESDFEFDAIPTFRYGDKKLYFPDFYLPHQNLIIEVKSDWTLQNNIDVTKQKQQAVELAGYKYRLIVWRTSNEKLSVAEQNALKRSLLRSVKVIDRLE